MIQEYVANTHGATHSSYTLEVLEVFSVARHGEKKRYKPFSKMANRMLLWHGSRITNFAGILSQVSLYCIHISWNSLTLHPRGCGLHLLRPQ